MDRGLVERAQGGDQEAYASLVAAASDRLYAVALRILRDADAAGDALQSALVQIWRDLPDLRDVDRFEAWTYRILVRCCQADRRRSRRSVAVLHALSYDTFESDSQVSVSQRDELERAFRDLPDEQRAVIVLLYYRDLTVAQIAEVLGTSIGTVKSRLHYARQAMRAALDADARGVGGQERSA